jgi:hypothetical protein
MERNIHTAFNWEDYREDIIGVIKPKGEKIQAKISHFYRKTLRYIEKKIINTYQKISG